MAPISHEFRGRMIIGWATAAEVEAALLTEEQRERLRKAKIRFADMLKGEFHAHQESLVRAIFTEWNKTLGLHPFGHQWFDLGLEDDS